MAAFEIKSLGTHIDEIVLRYSDGSYEELSDNYCPWALNVAQIEVPKDHHIVGLYGKLLDNRIIMIGFKALATNF